MFALAAAASAASAAGGAGVAEALTGLSSTAGALNGQFSQLTNVVARFVTAINPYLVDELNRAFRDLDAVIGSGLAPIITAATAVVREFASQIAPVMDLLRPIIEKLINAFATLFMAVIGNWMAQTKGLMPIIEFLANALIKLVEQFTVVIQVVRVFSEIGGAMIQWLATFLASFGIKITDASDLLLHVFVKLAEAVIMLTAVIFKLFGFTKGLDAIIRGLKPPDEADQRGRAVGQNPVYKQIADTGREAYLNAFVASNLAGGQKPKKPEEIMGDILKAVQQLRDEKTDIVKDIAAVMSAVVNNAVDRLINSLQIPGLPPLFGGGGGKPGPPPKDNEPKQDQKGPSTGQRLIRGAIGAATGPFGFIGGLTNPNK